MRLGPCFCERRSIIEEDQCGKKVILFHCIALATDTSWGNIRVELLSPMKTWHSFPIDTIRMKSSFMHPNFLHHSLRKFITQAILSLGSRNWECPPQKNRFVWLERNIHGGLAWPAWVRTRPREFVLARSLIGRSPVPGSVYTPAYSIG